MNKSLTWTLEKNIKNKQITLYLYNFYLTEIPEEIREFYWLKELHLNNNQIRSIDKLSNLIQLERLYLSDNAIENIENLSGLV